VADPTPPDTLGTAGAALWERILADVQDGWELDERELHLLESACHVRDQIDTLDGSVAEDGPLITGTRGAPTVHPGLQEARQLRLVELRLLRSLQLADPAANDTPATTRARKAANARWHPGDGALRQVT